MKLLIFIFTVYILLLPCLPCMEADLCEDTTQTAFTGSSSNGEEQQHENEPCNPFCSCACCGHVFSLTLHMNKMALVRPLAKKQQPFFYSNISLSSNFFGNIWQPPKVG